MACPLAPHGKNVYSNWDFCDSEGQIIRECNTVEYLSNFEGCYTVNSVHQSEFR